MSDEQELYHPASDFLMLVLDEEVPLSGSPMADANLARLIALTADADKSNRDWATFLLAQTEFDTPDISAALKRALEDEDEDVRSEALVGIAKREPCFALPHVLSRLEADWIGQHVLEAAGYVADAALLPALNAIARDCALDGLAKLFFDEALESCTTGIPQQWRDFDD